MTRHLAPRIRVRYDDAASSGDAFAIVRFAAQQDVRRDESVVLLRPLSSASAEIWEVDGEVRRGRDGRIAWSATEELLFAAVDPQPENDSLEEASYAAYAEMLRFIAASGYSHFLRIWNHVPRINEEPEGLERYRRFSIGRHRAFGEAGYALAGDLPAASAVGSHRGELTIYFLASKSPGAQIENPRQMSAFAYPPEYGPKSPSFSRGCVRKHAGGAEIFLSGTASIVGHESVHIGDLQKQLDETMLNIDTLLRHAGTQHDLGDVGLQHLRSLKVYVRHERDRDALHERLLPMLHPDCTLLYVEADICRRELLLEIEGVAEV